MHCVKTSIRVSAAQRCIKSNAPPVFSIMSSRRCVFNLPLPCRWTLLCNSVHPSVLNLFKPAVTILTLSSVPLHRHTTLCLSFLSFLSIWQHILIAILHSWHDYLILFNNKSKVSWFGLSFCRDEVRSWQHTLQPGILLMAMNEKSGNHHNN